MVITSGSSSPSGVRPPRHAHQVANLEACGAVQKTRTQKRPCNLEGRPARCVCSATFVMLTQAVV